MNRQWRRGTRVLWGFHGDPDSIDREVPGTVLEGEDEKGRVRVGWDNGKLVRIHTSFLIELDAMSWLGELIHE